MKPLSDAQYEALGRTRKKAGVPVSGPRKHGDGPRMIPEGHISPQVANVLIDAGFAQMVDGTLRSTKAGRLEFDRPRPGVERYLDMNPARPLTTSVARSARDEGAVMGAPHPDWADHAEARRKADRQDRDSIRLTGLDHPEERLRELRRLASIGGVDVSDEERFVQRAVRAYERKVRRDAA